MTLMVNEISVLKSLHYRTDQFHLHRPVIQPNRSPTIRSIRSTVPFGWTTRQASKVSYAPHFSAYNRDHEISQTFLHTLTYRVSDAYHTLYTLAGLSSAQHYVSQSSHLLDTLQNEWKAQDGNTPLFPSSPLPLFSISYLKFC